MVYENINKWVKGKNPFLCEFALEIIAGVDDIYEACQIVSLINLQKRLRDKDFINRWKNLYTNSAYFLGNAGNLMLDSMSTVDEQLVNSISDTEKLSAIILQEWQNETEGMSRDEILNFCNDLSAVMELSLKDYIRGLGKDSFDKPLKTKNIQEDETLLFFFKVWLPCWLEYGEYLPNLMTKAVNGNHNALINLVRLDDLIIEHDEIRYQWHKAKGINKTIAEDLYKAQFEQPLQNVTITNLKYLFGALIYQVFNRTDKAYRMLETKHSIPHPKTKISAEKIYQLFKAYFYDVTKSNTDDDLGTPGAFRTGITRYKGFWDSLLD